ncbi:MAG: ARMT1-like domain-containing protein [Planctomycetia bacterium]|nr:ARMT1-like domain-containing protein [Planctomycetia bacterium]
MKIQPACFPCIVRQAFNAMELLAGDAVAMEEILRRTCRLLAESDREKSPPALSAQMHREIREVLQCDDPYHSIKQQMNTITQTLLPYLQEKVEKAANPLEQAIRFAIAGNVIDFSTFEKVSSDQIQKTLEKVVKEPIVGLDVEVWRHQLESADHLLYIADNSGEIVLDRLLIEQLTQFLPVTLAVRGGPVVNDVTREDAVFAGLENICSVVETGTDAPGILWEKCGEDFRRCFQESDLVFAKGQGNFETLQPSEREIYHLFMVKCPVIAQWVQLPKGTFVGKRFSPVVEWEKI